VIRSGFELSSCVPIDRELTGKPSRSVMLPGTRPSHGDCTMVAHCGRGCADALVGGHVDYSCEQSVSAAEQIAMRTAARPRSA